MNDDAVRALELVLEEARRYLPELPDARVRPDGMEEAAHALAGGLPEEGIGTLPAIARLIEAGREAHIRSSGPRFFNWVIGGSTPAALAADWLASLLDQNAAAWESSPLSFQLEQTSIAWLLDLFELRPEWRGVLTTSATTANFTALGAACLGNAGRIRALRASRASRADTSSTHNDWLSGSVPQTSSSCSRTYRSTSSASATGRRVCQKRRSTISISNLVRRSSKMAAYTSVRHAGQAASRSVLRSSTGARSTATSTCSWTCFQSLGPGSMRLCERS